jgi:PspA/IM30 family
MILSSMVVDAYVTAFTSSSLSISRSSFVGRRNTLDYPSLPLSNLPHNKRSTTSLTVLHMNLFDRFSRVAKSNLNNILQSLEDPEKIMTQALEDMQVRLHLVFCF